jgi:hypothetical protein
MNGRLAVTLSLIVIVGSGALNASETARVGGDGGNRTVTMDCGSGAFIVGIHARGGKDFDFAPNIVRRIRFRCRTYDGTNFGSSATVTTEAIADAQPTSAFNGADVSCNVGFAISEIDLNAAMYIDRVTGATCISPTGGRSGITLNVGGDGGSRKGMNCPAGEAMYKVEARVGSSIDSLIGYCRSLVAVADVDPLAQMNESRSPKPSHTTPVKIMPLRSATFSFTVPTGAVNQRYLVGITAQTDFLGGGGLNPPDYRMELVTPSGNVVATRNVTTNSSAYETISREFSVSGGWKLRVINNKRDIGALDVIAFKVLPP